jgi:hypothetical protein
MFPRLLKGCLPSSNSPRGYIIPKARLRAGAQRVLTALKNFHPGGRERDTAWLRDGWERRACKHIISGFDLVPVSTHSRKLRENDCRVPKKSCQLWTWWLTWFAEACSTKNNSGRPGLPFGHCNWNTPFRLLTDVLVEYFCSRWKRTQLKLDWGEKGIYTIYVSEKYKHRASDTDVGTPSDGLCPVCLKFWLFFSVVLFSFTCDVNRVPKSYVHVLSVPQLIDKLKVFSNTSYSHSPPYAFLPVSLS